MTVRFVYPDRAVEVVVKDADLDYLAAKWGPCEVWVKREAPSAEPSPPPAG